MELRAAIEGLKALREPCRVTLTSDSQYLVNAVNLGWAARWQENGWMRGKKEEAKNPDLWEELLALLRKHDVEMVWTKGHANDAYNKRCDELAVAESKRF
jgi:ribonuclease HI